MSAKQSGAAQAARARHGASEGSRERDRAGARPPAALRCALAVARREWMSLVLAPVGWIAIAAFALPPGISFALGTVVPGAPVSMRLPLVVAAWSLFVVAPVLAWRSVGEERRQGTWDPLVSSPAGAATIVLAKLAAQWAFLLLLLLPLVAQCALVSIVARPDLGEFACGLLGVLLAGAMVLASSFWFAIVPPGPAAAYLLTIGTWSAWILLGRALPLVVPPGWSAAAHAIDPLRRVDDFLLGMLDPAGAIFLIAVAAWFVVASIDAVADSVRHGSAPARRPARAL
ncbi:MAG: ABC transporter permease, partial [Phycisphaerae bacterium]|nr:ABC transporter permease [Phycisphaerae bacterium]